MVCTLLFWERASDDAHQFLIIEFRLLVQDVLPLINIHNHTRRRVAGKLGGRQRDQGRPP